MRACLVVVCLSTVALVVVAAAQAQAPLAGFRESPRLEAPASFVAGRPVEVWCALDGPSWRSAIGSESEGTAGYSIPAEGVMYLQSGSCLALEQWGAAGVASAFFARGLLVLVHEAEHLAGHLDEAETECLALHRVAEVAIRFFGFKPYTGRLREVIRWVYAWHTGTPDIYRAVC